jgi:hypothetical protein
MATALAPAIPQITICPPGAASNAKLDLHVGMRRAVPIKHARFDAEGNAESIAIDWTDFGRMGYAGHKLNHGRKYETPDWVMDDLKLRAVTVRYVEVRAGFTKPKPGSDAERLKRAEARILAKLTQAETTLTRLCKEHLALKRAGGDAEYTRKLGTEIENLDTQLRVAKGIAGIAVRLATLYWKQGFTSVECAEELNLKPPHCRIVSDAPARCGSEAWFRRCAEAYAAEAGPTVLQ